MLSRLPVMPVRVAVSIGTILWLILGLERGLVERGSTTSLLDSVLLLAPLITVPLQLALLEPRLLPGAQVLLGAARLLQPPAAMLLAIAVVVPAGRVSGALAIPWLLCAAIAALSGVLQVAGGPLRLSAVVPGAALLYLFVGAAWALAYRADVQPFGNSPPRVELTAIHFQFAGLGAAVLAVLTAERCRPRRRGVAGAGALGVIVGTPLVAAGRTILVHASAAGAVLVTAGGAILALGVVTVGALGVTEVSRPLPGLARLLFGVAAGGVLISMALALVYAGAPLFGNAAPSVDTMAETHGVINAFLFVLASTLAWTVVDVTGL